MSIEWIRKYIAEPGASLLKALLMSRPAGRPLKVGKGSGPERPLIVMGNGPSLRSFIDFAGENPEIQEKFDLAAVNFAAITPEFFTLRPDMYVLADPHFFTLPSPDAKVEKLWRNLEKVNWPMTLWIPARVGGETKRLCASLPANVKVRRMNLTPVEGRGPIADFLIGNALGMPRPRNVLIPAIMTALWSGYRRIYLAGADHSWLTTLRVDDSNRLISVQPHFYKDDATEQKRVDSEYAGYHLHDILHSMTIAFRSYFDILRYAGRLGAEIINVTPGSFIDAFPRCGYGQMTRL